MKNSRRYYLHRKIKQFARLEAKNGKGIIYLPYNFFDPNQGGGKSQISKMA